jgi:predicted metal-dependent hydrolase
MPRFHFNVIYTDHEVPDPEGEEFLDVDAARREALASARETLANAIRNGEDAPQRVQVTDDDGQEVATVALMEVLPHWMRKS